MWFSNLQFYRFTKSFTLSPEVLAEHLASKAFRPCGKLDLFTYGWVSPLGRYSDELVHVANGSILLCARKEEKVIPSSVIRDEVNERAQDIEQQQGRPVSRKEREAIKEEVLQDLLPKAFTRSQRIFLYISPKDNLLVVNCSSAKKTEELLSYLRTTLGSLPIVSPSLLASPAAIMTSWLVDDDAPTDFIIEDECELREAGDEGSIVRCKRQDLVSDEVLTHLKAGKQATKLSITWQDSLSCILNEDLSIQRLRFNQEVLDQGSDIDSDDIIAQLDNDFSVMTLELARFIPRLLEVLGGENKEAYNKLEQAA